MTRISLVRRLALLGVVALAAGAAQAKDITLLNVSYDPTRELALNGAVIVSRSPASGIARRYLARPGIAGRCHHSRHSPRPVLTLTWQSRA